MSTTPDADTTEVVDRTIPTVAVAIGACAAVLALASLVTVGGRFAVGVLVGGAIGVANFLLLARIGRAITGSRGGAALWGGVYFIKIAALFGGLYLLFHTRAIDLLGLVVGLCAIVPGIVVGSVLAAPPKPPSSTSK